MIRRPPRSTPLYSSAASDVYKRQLIYILYKTNHDKIGDKLLRNNSMELTPIKLPDIFIITLQIKSDKILEIII